MIGYEQPPCPECGKCKACGTNGSPGHKTDSEECRLLQADRFQKHSPVDQADDQ